MVTQGRRGAKEGQKLCTKDPFTGPHHNRILSLRTPEGWPGCCSTPQTLARAQVSRTLRPAAGTLLGGPSPLTWPLQAPGPLTSFEEGVPCSWHVLQAGTQGTLPPSHTAALDAHLNLTTPAENAMLGGGGGKAPQGKGINSSTCKSWVLSLPLPALTLPQTEAPSQREES